MRVWHNFGSKSVRWIAVFGLMLAMTTDVHAWSFTGDPEGQNLDAEARRVLTTQNVCGVIVDGAFLKTLYDRINKHFDKSLDYPLYLRRSVLSANSEYLANAEAPQIAKDCRPRIEDLRKRKLLVE